MSDPLEETILELLATRDPGKSVTPEDVARAANPDDWHRLLGPVRAAAQALAREGRLVILRKGKPVANPAVFKGVYRLRLP
jgi:hypothetical protein